MTSRPVWQNEIEHDAFVETLCRKCFQPAEAAKRVLNAGDGCPHLLRAAENKLPRAWTRRRNAVMGETYRCSDFAPKPPVNRRGTSVADTTPMFDDLPEDVDFVPVDGWPSREDFGIKGKKKDDHA